MGSWLVGSVGETHQQHLHARAVFIYTPDLRVKPATRNTPHVAPPPINFTKVTIMVLIISYRDLFFKSKTNLQNPWKSNRCI